MAQAHTSANTPRHEAAREEELAALRAEVERLRADLAARDDFIATASHELRNPMAAVVMSVTNMLFLARRGPETPSWIVPRLEALDRQARHFVRRATMLLDVSRIAAGAFTLDLRPVDLGELVESVVHELTPEAERAGCTVELRVQRGADGRWDAAALESIAYNLVSNAIKYGAGRPVGVSVTASPGVAQLEVCDRGVGIAPEDQARIFGRFERAASRTDRPGFGVGLWLARQLALAHGGDIAVESAPGQGSIFTASLPRGIHEPHP